MGITGGIATGKSLLSASLVALNPGLELFDSDLCARQLTESDPSIRAAIREEFGPKIFDSTGALRRAALRDLIFADKERRNALDCILHPAIRNRWVALSEGVRAGTENSWLAVDIPLLFETLAEIHFDKIVVVACSPATQRQRLIRKRNLPPDLVNSMIASQLPLATKIDRGDFAVWNDGLPEALQFQARLLSRHLFS